MTAQVLKTGEIASSPVLLSIIIPALEAEGDLGAALEAIENEASAKGAGTNRAAAGARGVAEGGGDDKGRLEVEVIVADGGSTDATAGIAARRGARLVSAPRGRGRQLAAGADAARGEWFLFLHSDTRLGPGWKAAVARFVANTGNDERAAAFRFALADATAKARRIERLVAWRCRALGLPYGDQGLLISRTFYDSLGGFKPMELMEDVDIIRRIGRARLRYLDVPAVTSAARYRKGGYVLRPLRNLFCLGLYFAGAPPRLIARLYR